MSTKNVVGMVVLGIVVVGILGISVFAVKAYQTPMGPSLDTNTPTPMPIKAEENLPTPTAIPVSNQTLVCGESAVWNILVLGSNTNDLMGNKGTDLIRMMHVDFPNKKVAIYAFPYDLWVDTNGLGLTDPAVNATQLGKVFYEARSRSTNTKLKDAMVDGTVVTARALSNNFSIGTDHYLTVDLNQIPAMVDTVGGIPINVPAAVTDPWIGMVIPAGPQTFNGAQFVAYARVVPDADDFGRIQRNNLLLEALRTKLLQPDVWAKIPELYTRFDESVATDLSPEQINHLSCLLKEIPTNSIVQDHVKQEWTTPGPEQGSLLWDKTKVFNRLQELNLVP